MRQQVNHRRIQHIVNTYQLAGEDPHVFHQALNDWLGVYVAPLIELALVETLVDGWLTVPMPRGLKFLHRMQERLAHWESHPIISTITPAQFHQITGLDPAPIFGNGEAPLPKVKVQG